MPEEMNAEEETFALALGFWGFRKCSLYLSPSLWVAQHQGRENVIEHTCSPHGDQETEKEGTGLPEAYFLQPGPKSIHGFSTSAPAVDKAFNTWALEVI